MKSSVHEVKLTGLWARNCATIQQVLISNFTFGPEKLPGLSKNGPLVSSSRGGSLWPVGPNRRKLTVPLPRILASSPTSLRNNQAFGRNVSGHPGGSTPGTYAGMARNLYRTLWIEGTHRPRGGVMLAFRGEILFFGGWAEFVKVVVQLGEH